jgi:hypothetical protein
MFIYGKAKVTKSIKVKITKTAIPPVIPDIQKTVTVKMPPGIPTPEVPAWKVIHTAADQQVDKLLNKIVDVSHDTRQGAVVTPMIQGINSNDAAAVLKAIPLETYAAGIAETTNILKIAFNDSGAGMIIHLPESYRDFTFDTASQRASNVVEDIGSKLVTEVTDETKAAINVEIKRGIDEGLGGDKVAKNIINLIGLTTKQAGAVSNFRAASLAAGVSNAQVDANAAEYADRLLNYRALTIARTETMRAANAGYKEMIQQGIEANMIPPTARMVWIVTPDDRLCEDCNDMDGQLADENGDFTEEIPLHPSCRCIIGTSFEEE